MRVRPGTGALKPWPSGPRGWARWARVRGSLGLTFCSRKPRSSERAQSRKDSEQVRMTTMSNSSRKLLSPARARGAGSRVTQGLGGWGSGQAGLETPRAMWSADAGGRGQNSWSELV